MKLVKEGVFANISVPMFPQRHTSPNSESPWALAAVTDCAPESETNQACWEVRAYSRLKLSKGVSVDSPTLVEAAGARFYLRAFLAGHEDSSEGCFALFCARENDPASDARTVSARFTITVVGKDGCMEFSHDANEEPDTFHPVSDENFGGLADFGTTQNLRSKAYLADDTLTFGLKVTAWTDDPPRCWKLPVAPGSSGCLASRCGAGGKRAALAADWAVLLASGQATDIELTPSLGEGERGVKAHRLVLAARSAVFNRMLLESSMREAQADAKVVLEGVDRTIAERFVHFIYTDELDQVSVESQDALCHLLTLGHRFEMPSLIEACSAKLTITDEVVVERLVMADQLGLPVLKEHALNYICSSRTRLASVQKTEAFGRASRSYPHLVVELLARATRPAAEESPPQKKLRVRGRQPS